ncbi:uncharacterized protein L969DRAFT_47413 [Mixia osmundae IAM 14324]|uniref:DUF952 domain-containing protein n=1 Tax=Mixia osmundae (strain CBS 9802 / IAM 14324 / JCM 22182 / KY 12970) TaxID=764103 RepID=G7E6F3_MIXOS|nr:uncharacterized protein L969DRAFT_47413 [Mixia osmundae IAM 14324]KEI40429.1 hypothetical protein L969DRAFT_47413 [Mixia osmundae IAM 14324]GAA98413.1 hypothetical protein E5Q_05099 [Mixia osmundae IAM 14324]
MAPRFVYKILPYTGRYYIPEPVPASFALPMTELDAKDGFVHLSTCDQVDGVLKRFYGPEYYSDAQIQLVRIDYERLSAWKTVKWEQAAGSQFPHLYNADVEGKDLSMRPLELLKRSGDEKGWTPALDRLRQSGWFVN